MPAGRACAISRTTTQLPTATIDDLVASGFTDLLVPERYGGRQAALPAILDPVRRMAHGDYDTGRELAGALTLGMPVPRTAMV